VLKDDGGYRTRTVAKGYNQAPGKYHKKLMNMLPSHQFDVETALLYRDMSLTCDTALNSLFFKRGRLKLLVHLEI
jgi:hypothetical protein